MSATLNGAKWWSDRARMLEGQRIRDMPELERLRAENARLKGDLAEAGRALDKLTKPK